ncbi:MAG: ABC transporter permease [Acidimicrobiia bacterium]
MTAAAPAVAEASGGIRWHRVRAVVRRHVLVQVRNPGHWFLLLVLPVVDALLFSSIGVAFGETDRAVEILVVGILLFHVIWQLTLAGSLGFLEEVWSRNVLNLWTTPLTENEYGLALLVTGFVRALVSMGLVAAVAAGLYAVDPTGAGWVLAVGAAALMVFGWAVALLVVGLVLQFGETAEVFSWGTLVLLMPLSGIFYPPEALPGVLQPVAQVVPLTRIFEATRQSLVDGSVQWVDLGLGAAGSLVCVGLAAWFVRRQLRRFREQGWITRFS